MYKFVKGNERTMDIEAKLVANIDKAMTDRGFKQSGLANVSGLSAQTISKILKRDQRLSIDHLSKIAKGLSLREIDLFTYPDVFAKVEGPENGPTEVLLQLRLNREKKDQVLKLVFGENDIEILNK